MRRSVCTAGEVNGVEAFGEGLQARAGMEVELHEAVQLSEHFGEWRVRPSGTRVVQGEWWMEIDVM